MAWEIFKSIPVVLQEPGLRTRFYIVAQPSYLRFVAYVGHGTGFGSDSTQVLIPYQQSEFDYSLYRYRFTILNYESYYNYLSINSTPTESQTFYGPMTANPIAGTSQIKNATLVIERELKNSPPTWLVIPTQNTKKDQVVTLNLANYSSDAENNVLSYTTTSSNPNIATATVSGNMLTLTGKTMGNVTITVTANDGKLTTSQTFTLNVTNTAPTVSVSSPSANVTLYENDVFNITGSASDVNANQSVTIYAQINLEQRIVLGIGLSNTPISFSKQLKFKGAKLFDGDTVITGNLTDGVPHNLKIWAQDGDGGQSIIVERAFYVVPNRAPLLSVDAVVPAGVVDSDKFKISGTSSDPDANANVKITKKVNANNPVEIYNGPGGPWEFEVSLAELLVGENTIVIEVIDNYGAKTSKTIKLKKNEVKTPILHAVARYKITPPAGSAKGVLLFIVRDEDMDLKIELSMTLAGEQEQYETLTADNTAPMPNTNGIVEDTYYHETTEPKDNIILKISTTRPDATVNHKIHLISGAVE
ncbi:Ig-like domain-containing protein (plasmid) [Lysinibacillus capsici]|uniref:Ig-like domain-containing protein n=1 Tax=Lysinibacillus capsici TaxID=2115968 RepID=UPI0021D8B3A4|nr:Ig-like domain-containing protein [Lysinibacillus capsici]UYB50394.1 Ig-like domain-containing protein [Lysinibacillus capsici]